MNDSPRSGLLAATWLEPDEGEDLPYAELTPALLDLVGEVGLDPADVLANATPTGIGSRVRETDVLSMIRKRLAAVPAMVSEGQRQPSARATGSSSGSLVAEVDVARLAWWIGPDRTLTSADRLVTVAFAAAQTLQRLALEVPDLPVGVVGLSDGHAAPEMVRPVAGDVPADEPPVVLVVGSLLEEIARVAVGVLPAGIPLRLDVGPAVPRVCVTSRGAFAIRPMVAFTLTFDADRIPTDVAARVLSDLVRL